MKSLGKSNLREGWIRLLMPCSRGRGRLLSFLQRAHSMFCLSVWWPSSRETHVTRPIGLHRCLTLLPTPSFLRYLHPLASRTRCFCSVFGYSSVSFVGLSSKNILWSSQGFCARLALFLTANSPWMISSPLMANPVSMTHKYISQAHLSLLRCGPLIQLFLWHLCSDISLVTPRTLGGVHFSLHPYPKPCSSLCVPYFSERLHRLSGGWA